MDMELQAEGFTAYLAKKVLCYLQADKANLVLFASYRQMREVAESLKVEFTKRGWALQVQGEKSRSEILNKHKS